MTGIIKNPYSFKNFRFLMCRHGQSLWNKENKFTGWTNISLTNKGRKDAFQIGEIIKSNNFLPTKIYTSDSKRAIDSAEIIKESLRNKDIDIQSNWRLAEKHYGGCEGLERSVIERRYGQEYLKHIRRSFLTRPPSLDDLNSFRLKNSYGPEDGDFQKKYYYESNELEILGENCLMVSQRINLYLNSIILPYSKDNKLPLIVSHNHPLRVLHKSLLSLSNEEFEKFDINNKTVFLVTSLDGKITIKKLKRK